MHLPRTYYMKRPTTSTEQEEIERADVSMAETLILLSLPTNPEQPRVFECKTCNRQFSSFQALGGHRASHKKPRLQAELHGSVAKPKVHECSICGVEFAIGQALGGHMRRHRGEVKKDYVNSKSTMLFGFDLTAAVAAKEVELDKGLLTFKLGLHNHTVVQG